MPKKKLFKNPAYKIFRNAHCIENTEDYLELIGDLLNNSGEARIVDIANKMDRKLNLSNQQLIET